MYMYFYSPPLSPPPSSPFLAAAVGDEKILSEGGSFQPGPSAPAPPTVVTGSEALRCTSGGAKDDDSLEVRKGRRRK